MALIAAVAPIPFESMAAARDRLPRNPRSVPAPAPASVYACGCAGECRCGTMVPYLLLHQIELECEFYRDVH